MIVIRRGYKRKYQVSGSEIFQSSKTFCQDSSVKSRLSTPSWTLLEVLGKRLVKSYWFCEFEIDSQKILSKLVSSVPPLAPQEPQQVTAPNLNNLIAESGQRAIKIHDLVKRLNKQ